MSDMQEGGLGYGTLFHPAGAQDRNESLFFHVLSENIEELLPIVHMPTVSQYCQTYGLMFKSLPRSLFISTRDRGAPRLRLTPPLPGRVSAALLGRRDNMTVCVLLRKHARARLPCQVPLPQTQHALEHVVLCQSGSLRMQQRWHPGRHAGPVQSRQA